MSREESAGNHGFSYDFLGAKTCNLPLKPSLGLVVRHRHRGSIHPFWDEQRSLVTQQLSSTLQHDPRIAGVLGQQNDL